MWSCSARDGGHTGQYVRYAASPDGTRWASSEILVPGPEDGYLYRAVSRYGGRTFTPPLKTDFPDCGSKHFCLRLSSGHYVLINNPESRKVLQVAGSADGIVFSQAAKLRHEPVALRNPGHDKGSPYSYPHALEHEGQLYIAYSVNRDDIWISMVPLEEISSSCFPVFLKAGPR